MKGIIFFLLIASPIFCTSQSLTPERVAKLKSATVRITIEDTTVMGTGFFINENGMLLTCWHVIAPFLNPIGNRFRKIYVELNTGEKLEVGVPNILIEDSVIYRMAVAYDFCELGMMNPTNKKFPFLRIGNYNDLNEGDEVYTCGYPLGIKQQFISQGIVSTKYFDTVDIKRNNIVLQKFNRSQALLDLTLNKGNSGGAMVKKGNSINEDVVVGIADFVLVPFAQAVENLYNLSSNNRNDILLSGISTMKAFQLFSIALSYASNGISGCVSINHFLDAVQSLKKK